MERIQKLIASNSKLSRRQVEKLIKAGKVRLNNEVAILGAKADLNSLIEIGGQPLILQEKKDIQILAYHKPIGLLCTRRDELGRRTVFSDLPAGNWIIVGRLDLDTSGLLLFTNDGELANELMHPRNQVEREYLVHLDRKVSINAEKAIIKGIELEDGLVQVQLLKKNVDNSGECYQMIVSSGRNRMIRRLWAHLGFEVVQLQRTRYGSIKLDLSAGSHRMLSAQELYSLGVDKD